MSDPADAERLVRPPKRASASSTYSCRSLTQSAARPVSQALADGVRNRLGSARPPAYELLIGVDRVVTCDGKGDAQGQDSPLRHKNRRIAIVLS